MIKEKAFQMDTNQACLVCEFSELLTWEPLLNQQVHPETQTPNNKINKTLNPNSVQKVMVSIPVKGSDFTVSLAHYKINILLFEY